MSTNSFKEIYKRHRVAFIVGTVAGVGLIGGVFAYNIAMTPPKPDMGKASACEVVAFIGNSRGLARLPQIEQEQFLDQWKVHVMKPENRKQLKECFDTLEDSQRKDFSAAVFKHAKRAFLDDAEGFAALKTSGEKDQYLRGKIKGYTTDALFTKEVAASFKGDATYRQDDLQAWIMENTTAKERSIGEPYVEALKRIREQVKKEERTQASAAPR